MIQSDLKETYKFIFDFFKLLKATFGSSVANWEISDLHMALKWASAVEDMYKKIEKKTYLNAFIVHVKVLFNYWNLNDLSKVESVQELLKCASRILNKSLLSNIFLSNEVKTRLFELVYNKALKELSESMNNPCWKDDLIEKYYEQEVDRLCINMLYPSCDASFLIDNLLEFTMNSQNNMDFLIDIVKRLRSSDYQTFKTLILRFFNKKFKKLLVNRDSLKLFKLVESDAELIRAYYCYLLYSFTDEAKSVESAKLTLASTNDSKEASDYDQVALIVEHLESAIEMSNDVRFIKIMQRNKLLPSNRHHWDVLIEKVKSNRLKEIGEIEIEIVDMPSQF